MNRFTMALQAFIVVFLLGIVLVIGYSQQDKGYITYTRELRSTCKKYMVDKKIKNKMGETTVIFMSDLENDGYIETAKNDYCIVSVLYRKGILFGKFKANKDCEYIDRNATETNSTEEENNTTIKNETLKEE